MNHHSKHKAPPTYPAPGKLPTFEAPHNPFVAFYQRRLSEARATLAAGGSIDWDQAKADYCALLRAKQPPVHREVEELEAPKPGTAKAPTLPSLNLTNDEIMKQLGF